MEAHTPMIGVEPIPIPSPHRCALLCHLQIPRNGQGLQHMNTASVSVSLSQQYLLVFQVSIQMLSTAAETAMATATTMLALCRRQPIYKDQQRGKQDHDHRHRHNRKGKGNLKDRTRIRAWNSHPT